VTTNKENSIVVFRVHVLELDSPLPQFLLLAEELGGDVIGLEHFHAVRIERGFSARRGSDVDGNVRRKQVVWMRKLGLFFS